MTSEPMMLTRMVPQGNASPVSNATCTLNHNRAMLPIAPPRATQK